jgi:hypothetical protein
VLHRALVAAVAVAVAVAGSAGVAHAEVVDELASGGSVDWSRGLVTATGIGLADRHAPSPAVGRAASRRRADDDARNKLAAALGEVAWTSDGSPAELAGRDGWIAAHAVVVDATLNPDGSWRVTLGLPVEAIRLGLAGARALPADGDVDETRAIVIDARAIDAAPVGGIAIGAAKASGATLWVDKPPGAALVGDKPVERKARKLKNGVIEVDGTVPDLAGTLIVVVVRRP